MPSQTGSIDLTAQVAANTDAKDYTDNVEVGGRNLFSVSTGSVGHIATATGAIAMTASSPQHISSDFVKVSPGDQFTMQFWNPNLISNTTNSNREVYWYDSSKTGISSESPHSGRPDGTAYWTDTFTAPANAAYARFGAVRGVPNFVDPQIKVKVERGNKPTDWTPAPEDVNSDGVNLLLKSANLDDTNIWKRSAVSSIAKGQADPDGGTGAFLVTPSSNAWYLIYNTANGRLKTLGETYTFSVWLKAASATTCNLCVRYLNSKFVDGTSATATSRKTVNVTTSWQRFTLTGALMTAQTADVAWIGQLTNVAMYVYHPKLEIGSVATEWSPAPRDVIAETHRIYYRTATKYSSGALAAPTTWVSEATARQYEAWSTKVSPITNTGDADSSASGFTKYPYLFTCEQRRYADGTLECTKVLLDENTTVIDGGNIITGSVTANQIDANSVKADIVQTTDLVASQIKSGTIDAARINTSQLIIGSSTLGDELDSKATPADIDDAVDAIEIGGRNLLKGTGDWSCMTNKTGLTISGDTATMSTNNTTNRSSYIPVEAGEWYTVSVDVKASAAATYNDYATDGDMYFLIDRHNSSGARVDYVTSPMMSLTTSWQRVSVTFQIPSSTTITQFFFGFRDVNANVSPLPSISMRHLMVEHANRATDWSPAPEDATASVVWNGTCDTAAGTAAKVVNCPGFMASNLVIGAKVVVRAANASKLEGALTLNVNNTGAKKIHTGIAETSSTHFVFWSAGATITFTYTGTYWRIADKASEYYATCGTAAATAAKTAAENAFIMVGTTAHLQMTYENTNTSATLNLGSTTARSIYYGSTSTRPTTSNGYGWSAGETAIFVFDGQFWRYTNASLSANTRDAAKTATNYIGADSSGIRIANATPSSATTYQHQTSSSTEFVVSGKKKSVISGSGLEVFSGDDEVSVAKFSDELRIGAYRDGYANVGSDKFSYIQGARSAFEIAPIGEDNIYDVRKIIASTAIDANTTIQISGGYSPLNKKDYYDLAFLYDGVYRLVPQANTDEASEYGIYISDVVDNPSTGNIRYTVVNSTGASIPVVYGILDDARPFSMTIGKTLGSNLMLDSSGLSLHMDGNTRSSFEIATTYSYHETLTYETVRNVNQGIYATVIAGSASNNYTEVTLGNHNFSSESRRNGITHSDFRIAWWDFDSTANMYERSRTEQPVSEYTFTLEIVANSSVTLANGSVVTIDSNYLVSALIPVIPPSSGVRYVGFECKADLRQTTKKIYSPTLRFGDLGFETPDEMGEYSSAFGCGLRAIGDHQTVIGRYNLSDANKAFIIGNGEATANTSGGGYLIGNSNAFTVGWDGTVSTAKDSTKNITLTNCNPYNNTASNTPTCYRRGNLVTISGIISPKSDVTNGAEVEIGTIAPEFKPPRAMYAVCHGSDSKHWLCQVKTSGSVTLARYGTGAAYATCLAKSSSTNGSWCLLSITYLVA